MLYESNLGGFIIDTKVRYMPSSYEDEGTPYDVLFIYVPQPRWSWLRSYIHFLVDFVFVFDREILCAFFEEG